MKLYTIGFTQKSAQEFFNLLKQNKIQRLVDIRLKPQGQLSGFAKGEDLPYFLDALANHCQYIHLISLAPTKEILESYRAGDDWPHYEEQFNQLMDEREIPHALSRAEFERYTNCFLCSESTPEYCHRRLVAERIAAHWPGVEITHL